MARRTVTALLVDHGGTTDLTLFEVWSDGLKEFERVVADYEREPRVIFERGSERGRRWAQNDYLGVGVPFIEVRTQRVEPRNNDGDRKP